MIMCEGLRARFQVPESAHDPGPTPPNWPYPEPGPPMDVDDDTTGH